MSGIEAAERRAGLEPLLDLLRGGRVVALGGAGCSTESGIPDYRGPAGALRHREPIQYQEFIGDARIRARYWSRSLVGWPRIARARPNAAHRALARLEDRGVVAGVITQNVDGLHHAAGSRAVIELHGSLGGVRCLACGSGVARSEFQARLLERNPGWPVDALSAGEVAESAPDGDAEVPSAPLETFVVPACAGCGGVMKPDVVFFGENVPPPRVRRAWEMLNAAEGLLVVGSSLTVYSGRRFVYGARERGIPVAIINLGPTRGDEFASVKIDARLGEVLPELADALCALAP